MTQHTKVGRNDPCSCGSGLKYKKCCLKNEQLMSDELSLARIQLKQEMNAILSKDVVILESSEQEVKMSGLILEFADDMLRHADTQEETRKALSLACVAWNLACVKEKSVKDYEKQVKAYLKELGVKDKDEDAAVFKDLIAALVDKKMNEYSGIDRLVMGYQIDFKKDKLIFNGI